MKSAIKNGKENYDKIDEKLIEFKTPNLLNSMLPYN